jgi:hypothetical protein
MNRALRWLVPAIFVLALAAALAGLWPGEGASHPITSFRGEKVEIEGRGLYRWDTVSTAAQERANDLVTLALGLPLLAASFVLSLRGSLRGRLLLTGTLGFFLYTYLSMSVGTAYNPFFLVYVALLGLSLYAFILSMMSFDLRTLPSAFSERLPRAPMAVLLFFAAAFLAFAWLGRVAASRAPGAVALLENGTSMFIQAMDLSLIAPLCVLSGLLLLRRSAWGYLLASVGMMKFLTMGAAVSLMALNVARKGLPIGAAELIVFPAITLANLAMVVFLLRDIKDPGRARS